MEKRIILFLILSLALIVLYPYVMDKMGLTRRPQPARPQKDIQAPPSPINPPSVSSASRLPTPAATGERKLLPSEARDALTKGDIREQEVTVDTDLIKVVFSNRGGVIKSWELKQYHTQDAKNRKEIQLVPTQSTSGPLIPPLELQIADPKLQQRVDRGLYQVSTANLSLTEAQPTGE